MMVTLPCLALYPNPPSLNTAFETFTGATASVPVDGTANFSQSRVPLPLTGFAPAAAIYKDESVAFATTDHPAAPAKP